MRFFEQFVKNRAVVNDRLIKYYSTKKLWFNVLMVVAFAACLFSLVHQIVTWTADTTALGIITGFATAAAGWYTWGKRINKEGN